MYDKYIFNVGKYRYFDKLIFLNCGCAQHVVYRISRSGQLEHVVSNQNEWEVR